MAKLYSKILNPDTIDVPRGIDLGISLAWQFGLRFVSGKLIPLDGNCWISTVTDQFDERFILEFTSIQLTILYFLERHLSTKSAKMSRQIEKTLLIFVKRFSESRCLTMAGQTKSGMQVGRE